ncbi:MAG: hypothetical protein ABSD98_02510 [Candidatus Korobacteraceae bacterium]|jgi:hypothetical protein
MFSKALNLAFNVSHALQICPPDYVHSILGDPDSWSTETCPRTELQLAEVREWSKGLPALAHILIPAVPWTPPPSTIPFSDLLFRPSVVFRYPLRSNVPNPTPKEMWFFINGICTDHSVVLLNAEYLYSLFERPLTVVHNFTRGIIPDLAACAVGKGWDQVTESAAVAFPSIYAALKDKNCERVILLGHSQGTILSAVVLALLQELRPRLQDWLRAQVEVGPERAVARKLAKRWHFERTMQATPEERDAEPDMLPNFPWPRHGRRQPEPVTLQEFRKLEIYCFANCASEMRPIPIKRGGANQTGPAWIESYGNEMDIVARLGVLANLKGPGSVRIAGDRYMRNAAWGHLLNAHYLHPMMAARSSKQPAGGLVALKGNRRSIPRLFGYLDAKSPPLLR